jgi:hypothetical protein
VADITFKESDPSIIPIPPTGANALFVNASGIWQSKDSGGVVTDIGTIGASVTTVETVTGDVLISGIDGIGITVVGQAIIVSGTTGGGSAIIITGTAPILVTGSTIGIGVASASTNGYLTSTDWNAFHLASTGLVGYLPLTGGTLTGGLTGTTINATNITVSNLLSGTTVDATTLNVFANENINGNINGNSSNFTIQNVTSQQQISVLGASGITMSAGAGDFLINGPHGLTQINGGAGYDATYSLQINGGSKDFLIVGGGGVLALQGGAAGINLDGNGQALGLSGTQITTSGNIIPTSTGINSIGSIGSPFKAIYADTVYESGTQVLTTGIGIGVGVSVSNGVITITGINTSSTIITGTAPILVTGSTVGIGQATASTDGYLTSTDWNKFNVSATGSFVHITGDAMTGGLNGTSASFTTITGTDLQISNIQGNPLNIGTDLTTFPNTKLSATNNQLGIGADTILSISSSTSSVNVSATGGSVTFSTPSIALATSGSTVFGTIADPLSTLYSNIVYQSGVQVLTTGIGLGGLVTSVSNGVITISATGVGSGAFVHITGDAMTGGLNGTSANFSSITGTSISGTTGVLSTLNAFTSVTSPLANLTLVNATNFTGTHISGTDANIQVINAISVTGVQYGTVLSSGSVPLGQFSRTINWNSGTSQVINFAGATGNLAISFSNGIPGSTYVLQTIQNTSGTSTVTWNTGTTSWAGGISGTLTASGSAIDLFPLYYNGVRYLANSNTNYF